MKYRFIEFDSLISTNLTAKEHAKKGAEEGLVITALEQTGGRGQMGRSFLSPPGGLYMSILLRPPFPQEEAPLLTALCGVAVRRAVARVTGEEPLIKWPNDIYLGGKKVCGILCEMVDTPRGYAAVLGIGVNVNSDPALLPPEAGLISKKNLDIGTLKGIILTDVGALYEKWDKSAIIKEMRLFLYAPSAEMEQWLARYLI